jgi:hypothetical protein
MSDKLFNNTKKITDTREDVSNLLFHFTKEPNAQTTLDKILSEGKLIAGECGYICFTEAPITMLPKMIEYFATYNERAKFAPYGVAFSKSLLFYKGARPVIYSDYGEDALLDPSIRWRHQDFHPIILKGSKSPQYRDYSWMREWRLPKKEFSFSAKQSLVITKESWEDFLYQELQPMNDPYDDIPEWKRNYCHISFQDITNDGINISKQKMLDILSEQTIGEYIE